MAHGRHLSISEAPIALYSACLSSPSTVLVGKLLMSNPIRGSERMPNNY
jgi:hypothetical protein